MKTPEFFIDLHCHPAIKPYGHSLPGKVNSHQIKNKSSVWHSCTPTTLTKWINRLTGLTKFRQSDFHTLCNGRTTLISASLYPLEKGFLVSRFGTGKLIDLFAQLVVGVARRRVNQVQGFTDYFEDLENEMAFYRQMSGKIVQINGRYERYVLARSINDILVHRQTARRDRIDTVSVVMSIEGGHVFNSGLDPKKDMADPKEVLKNVEAVKNWRYAPLFISLAHHFYNELCGHAPSLNPIVSFFTSQKRGMNTGFTPLGKEVVRRMFDRKTGRRMLIDIKHMSLASRIEYYQMLEEEYASDDLPVFVSHGAVNGWYAPDARSTFLDSAKGKFMQNEINFFDSELLRIARSGGIFGIQMDERRVGSKKALRKAKRGRNRKEKLYNRAGLLWNQIQHIAEVLDQHGLDAWNIQAIGSDYDGIIDPINGFWTHAEMPLVADYLLKHAQAYMAGPGQRLQERKNRIVPPKEIIRRIAYGNAWRFLERYFTPEYLEDTPVRFMHETANHVSHSS